MAGTLLGLSVDEVAGEDGREKGGQRGEAGDSLLKSELREREGGRTVVCFAVVFSSFFGSVVASFFSVAFVGGGVEECVVALVVVVVVVVVVGVVSAAAELAGEPPPGLALPPV